MERGIVACRACAPGLYMSLYGPENTTFGARVDQIACIVLHATQVDTSLDIPTAMCLISSACIDEIIEEKPEHVFVYVDGSVRHPNNPTPAASATATVTGTATATVVASKIDDGTGVGTMAAMMAAVVGGGTSACRRAVPPPPRGSHCA